MDSTHSGRENSAGFEETSWHSPAEEKTGGGMGGGGGKSSHVSNVGGF